MRRRVVVTGIGMVTPIGKDVDTTWQALQQGASGVGPITLFDARTFPTRIAAEIHGFDLKNYLGDVESWPPLSRNSIFALAAGKMAMDDAGLDANTPGIDRSRLGVYFGAGEGQQDFPHFCATVHSGVTNGQVYTDEFIKNGLHIMDKWAESEQDPGTPTAHVAAMANAQGPNYTCLTACAASSQAIGEAMEQIRRGDADIILSGGTHSMIHPFGITGFILLTALSTRNDDPQHASRPFDEDRDGFILGEGAGVVVLEELEHALKRGARIYGELIGYGSTADAFRITDSHDEGRGAIACLKEAIADAGISPNDINYINAHGTSTEVNDKIETLAIKHALGEHAYKVPVSSTKSMMGHLIAAAGAVEAIICLLAIRDGIMPPTINLEKPSEDCDLDYIPGTPRHGTVNVAVSNSFGFGGQNVSLILRKFTA
ncbi:MAG: beta-ketoacyl-ACP synthase II [bacterium]